MRTSEILLSIAAFVVIVAGMKAAAVIVVPFILSAFIAIICAPLMSWLQKKGVPAIPATPLTVLLIVSTEIVMAALVGQSVNDSSQDLPLYKEKIKAQTQAVAMWLAHSGIEPGRLQLNEIFDPAAAMNLAAAVLNGLGNVLANGFLTLMTVILQITASKPLASSPPTVCTSRRFKISGIR